MTKSLIDVFSSLRGTGAAELRQVEPTSPVQSSKGLRRGSKTAVVPWWVRKRLRLRGEDKADKAAKPLKPAAKPAKTLNKNVQVRCML